MNKAVIRDTERGEELTLTALREEYETLKNAGETEAVLFEWVKTPEKPLCFSVSLCQREPCHSENEFL